MCLILLAYGVHPRFPLVFAANRDEFHERPTAPAAFWDDAPHVLAGRDLRAGGTWMGVARDGRWAALTNFRDPEDVARERSRGELVAGYLTGTDTPDQYLRQVAAQMDEFSGFNLLIGDTREVAYVGNRGGAARRLPPGVYGLSNHLLDTPWPKVRRGTRDLEQALAAPGEPHVERLFEILAGSDPASDDELPETGVGREWERVLSSLFIVSPAYGTRASTVLLMDTGGRVTFVERSFRPGPQRSGEVVHRFAAQGIPR